MKHPRSPHRAESRARTPAGAAERLQKRLANAGVGSRREVEAWIRAGRLTVNGLPAVLGQKVVPADLIRLDDRPVRQRAAVVTEKLYIAHRSPGEDLREELMLRLPKRSGRRFMAVSPMPHQDGGIELLTADGALAAQLQRSVNSLVSEFRIRIRGELAEPQRAGVLGGRLDDGAQVTVLTLEDAGGEGANRWVRLEARGASGREVRQLMERNGALVSRVLRTRFGTLALTRDLLRGQFRTVEQSELRALMAAAGLLASVADTEPDESVDAQPDARSQPAEYPADLKPGRRKTVPSRRGPPDRAGRGRGG